MNQYWVAHPDRVWVPCKVKATRTDDASLITDEGEVLVFPLQQLKSLQQVQADQIAGVDDICSLAVVNEGTLLHTVRTRYFKQLIYTRVSRILIAMNPFTPLPIYSSQYMEQYKGDSLDSELPPHIFGIGKYALAGLRDSSRDQAVLISGESGAGKTESAKLILSFVADAVKGDQGGIEDQVLQTNPVLEAFGNAMTARNNNSSRFGKWLDLRFSGAIEIMGCSLTSYLLETTRVCGQASNERGFHVFFQLLQARENPEFAELKLAAPSKYKYVSSGRATVDGIDDRRNFEELLEAMTALGFDKTAQLEVFKILGGILSLGNGDFKEKGEGSQFEDEIPTRRCAELLDVNAEKLIHRMLHREIRIGREVTEAPLRVEQARGFRDSFARLLYGRLFLWLIQKMNKTLQIGQDVTEKRRSSAGAKARRRRTIGGMERLLGVLDIAGFECFEHNSLEQMLINLSNEHLQQHFNQSFLKAEIEDCEREGVKAPEGLSYNDNKDCLELFDGRGGILDLLDEEMSVPKATDTSFISKTLRNHGKNQRVICPKIATDGFGIKHFAGPVHYDATGWLEKNAGSTTSEELADMLEKSSVDVVSEIGRVLKDEITESAGQAGRKKVKSASGVFRVDLRALMSKIMMADPHYVRCIKPNVKKVPDQFMAPMVMEQLRFSGVLAAVQIRQQGYAIRTLKDEFQAQYRCIICHSDTRVSNQQQALDAEKLVERLPGFLKALNMNLDPKHFAVGKTKIFMKVAAFETLEVARHHALGSSATTIQRIFRGFWSRKRSRLIRDLCRELQHCITKVRSGGGRITAVQRPRQRSSSWMGDSLLSQLNTPEAMELMLSDLLQILERVEQVAFKNEHVTEAQSIVRRLRQEISACASLAPLQESKDVAPIEAALARCKALRFPETDQIRALRSRVKQLKVQLPLVRAMRKALAVRKMTIPHIPDLSEEHEDSTAKDPDDGMRYGRAAELDEIAAEVKDSGLHSGDEWLPELGGAHLYNKVLQKLSPENTVDQESEATRTSEVTSKAEAPASQKASRVTATSSSTTKKKASITGLDPVERTVLLAGLRRAAEDLDADNLERLLGRAAEDGLYEADLPEDLVKARKVFEDLQDVDFLSNKLSEICEQASDPQPPLLVLRQTEHLLERLRKEQGYEEQCLAGSTWLQQAMASRRQKRRSRNVSFASPVEDKEEAELAQRIFRKLAKYGRLKPFSSWLGHRRTSFPASEIPSKKEAAPDGIVESMLTHSNVVIAEALTTSPDGSDEAEYEAGALQNFWNVVVWMNDRPAQECQRIAARSAVVGLAKDVPWFRPEVYMQIMKQLNRNPSSRSAMNGWELLQELCKEAPPDHQLEEFVRAFLISDDPDVFGATPQHQLFSKSISRACLLVLERGHGGVGSGFWEIMERLWSQVLAINCVACRDHQRKYLM